MCGIVGAVAQRDIAEILLEGLRRLEYRGYDSAGLAVVDSEGHMTRVRRLGKVQMLAQAVEEQPLHGGTGIAHTRWATHGEPSESNAHPHVSEHIVVVHNGIIENHEPLRALLQSRGYVFVTETDTEVIAHLVHWELEQGGTLREAVLRAIPQLRAPTAPSSWIPATRELCWRPAPVAHWLSVWAWVKTLSPPTSWRCCRLPAASSSSKRAILRK